MFLQFLTKQISLQLSKKILKSEFILRPCKSSNSTRGFTLIELLVVIAILALLVGIFIPTLGFAMHRSRVSSDTVNLRLLQTAHYQYAVDSKGKFADAGLAHGGLENEEIAWLNTLSDYGLDIENIVKSPIDESPFWEIPLEGSSDRFRKTSYGWNNFLSRTHSPDAAFDPRSATDSLGKITRPSNVVHFLHMAGRGSFAGADHVHVENWWVNDALPDAPPILASNQVETNIVGGVESTNSATSNYGFIDGHVETLPFNKVYIRPGNNRFDPKVNSFLN